MMLATCKNYTERNFWYKWNETDSISQIATAAAEINRDADQLLLNVSQGIAWDYEDIQVRRMEAENAFTSAKYANEIYPGTVSSVLYNFGNEFKTITTHLSEKIRQEASTMGLRIGGMLDCSELISSDLHWPENTSLTRFLAYFDFVVCDETTYANEYSVDPSVAVKKMGKRFMQYSDNLRRARPSVSIMLGNLLWPSKPKGNEMKEIFNIENMYKYWTTVGKWAQENKVEVRMFEAFDVPLRKGVLAHSGWWQATIDEHGIVWYMEKAIGKLFFNTNIYAFSRELKYLILKI